MYMREREREGGKETDGERKSHPRPSPFLTPSPPPSPLLHPNPLRLSPYAFKCPRTQGRTPRRHHGCGAQSLFLGPPIGPSAPRQAARFAPMAPNLGATQTDLEKKQKTGSSGVTQALGA